MKRVLIIGYVWPEPNSSAAGSHMMSLLRLFRQQDWQVEFASPAQTSEHMIDLAKEGISTKSIELNSDSFDEYLMAYQPDMVMFDRFMMEEQFAWRVEKNCPQALRILDTEDLQCLRHARQQAYKSKREMSKNDLYSDIAKREIAAILRSDISLIISSVEMDLLINTFKIDEPLLHHLPFMVDVSGLAKCTKSFAERKHFVSIGNFRHAPNWDAVLQLQKIWPAIRQQIPTAELHIYGAYPPPKASALNNPKTGFLIKGWAENARDVIEASRVCLAPLQFGAGIKGKLLDAMMTQTPSVTTSIGAEGMCLGNQWPGVITDDMNEFTEAAIELYNNENAWLRAQSLCLDVVVENYNSERLGNDLIEKIANVNNNLEQQRLNNFTGAMLRHHSMSSTKYMSQWIAAKNAKE